MNRPGGASAQALLRVVRLKKPSSRTYQATRTCVNSCQLSLVRVACCAKLYCRRGWHGTRRIESGGETQLRVLHDIDLIFVACVPRSNHSGGDVCRLALGPKIWSKPSRIRSKTTLRLPSPTPGGRCQVCHAQLRRHCSLEYRCPSKQQKARRNSRH